MAVADAAPGLSVLSQPLVPGSTLEHLLDLRLSPPASLEGLYLSMLARLERELVNSSARLLPLVAINTVLQPGLHFPGHCQPGGASPHYGITELVTWKQWTTNTSLVSPPY